MMYFLLGELAVVVLTYLFYYYRLPPERIVFRITPVCHHWRHAVLAAADADCTAGTHRSANANFYIAHGNLTSLDGIYP